MLWNIKTLYNFYNSILLDDSYLHNGMRKSMCISQCHVITTLTLDDDVAISLNKIYNGKYHFIAVYCSILY